MLKRLLLLCLAAVAVAGKDGAKEESPRAQDAEGLASAVINAAKSDWGGNKSNDTVVSTIVPNAPPAELANGDGDLSVEGACEADIEGLCLKIPPGEGRLAECLTTRMKNEDNGNVTGRKVSKGCRKEVFAFYQDRSKSINKNLQLATACKGDVEKFCKDTPTEEGAITACLRSHQKKLVPTCQVQIFKSMLSGAFDMRTDVMLSKACAPDAKRLCSDVPKGKGRLQSCLRSKPAELSAACKKELFRQEVENSDDIRLSVKLHQVCKADQERYCSKVEYGGNRVKKCLEKHRKKRNFSSECRKELEAMMERRSKDFRLDPELTENCEKEIHDECLFNEESMEMDQDVHQAKVIMCLEDASENIKNEKCKAAVHHVKRLASEDFRFNADLAEKCMEDRKKYCSNHQPGSSRVIGCLQETREHGDLSVTCGEALFELEVQMAEDIDFQVPLQEACSEELTHMCQDEQEGHGRIVRCLQKQLDDKSMGGDCRKEVRKNVNRMSQDYRLNYRLHKACKPDIDTLCKYKCKNPLMPCSGKVLRCLQDKMDSITGTECRDEVFYFIKMEVSDYRNDIALAEACREDVDKFCDHVEGGDGRVLDCLRSNRKDLQQQCRKEELRISQIQSRDVRLRPKLMKLCSEEMLLFCDVVKPGGGRMFNCLLENVEKPTFGAICKAEIIKREDRAKDDYRLDAGVSQACAAHVAEHCASEELQAAGHAEVLSCLVDSMVDPAIELSDACEKQMSRAVRMAFWDYTKGAALTGPCDEDVESICVQTNRTKGVFSIGYVGRCLSKQLASRKPLNGQCRKLVTVAAPKDVRAYLQESLNPDGTMKGEESYFQTAMQSARTSASFITLNGWVAVLSVMSTVLVVAGGAYWVFRRASGLDRPHTTFVSRGETSGSI